MQYFVVLPDGQRFGPADIATLNQWAGEGRIAANCMIEDASTRAQTPATAFPGLTLPGAAEAAPTAPGSTTQDWNTPPTAGSPYPRGGYVSPTAGQGEMTAAWILGAVTFLFCCPVLPGLGLYFANRAMALGNPNAQAPRIFNIVVLVLSCLVYVGYALFFVIAMSTAMSAK